MNKTWSFLPLPFAALTWGACLKSVVGIDALCPLLDEFEGMTAERQLLSVAMVNKYESDCV